VGGIAAAWGLTLLEIVERRSNRRYYKQKTGQAGDGSSLHGNGAIAGHCGRGAAFGSD